MTLGSFACHVCGERDLVEVPGYECLPRVTSDCKPFPAGGRLAVCGRCGAVQKPSDARWREETTSIYRDYDIYYQSGGVEQSVFDPVSGSSRLRSEVMLERLDGLRPLPETGDVLDVGCGKGTFLSAFSEFRPGWRLSGHELTRANEAVLARLPSFERLYTGPLSDLPDAFDLVTLVHSLEHFDEPLEGLRDLAPKLRPGGTILIEVPNAAATPFDLLIADHASHFTRTHLAKLAQRAGLATLAVADDWIVKELSLAAARGETDGKPHDRVDPAAVRDALGRRVGWLQGVLAAARDTARRPGQFGIFGTSTAAMWLYGEIEEAVDFFVDEDPARIGTLHGRPVLTPDRIPGGATVYVMLIPAVAGAVAARIRRPDIRVEVPRDLE